MRSDIITDQRMEKKNNKFVQHESILQTTNCDSQFEISSCFGHGRKYSGKGEITGYSIFYFPNNVFERSHKT